MERRDFFKDHILTSNLEEKASYTFYNVVENNFNFELKHNFEDKPVPPCIL